MYFRKHTRLCQLVGCARKTSVSHSSAEADIISLDAGLRMDGIPALTLWDLVIEVFLSVPNRTDGPQREPRGNPSAVVKPNMNNPIPIKRTNVIPINIVHIPPNTTLSGFSAMLYVFERGSNQDDCQRSKSHNEPCFTDPQSCSGFVV